MNALITPHASTTLKPLLLIGDALTQAQQRVHTLPLIPVTHAIANDLIMLGCGAFTPLSGFMGCDDWLSVCDDLQLKDGTFWPIPILCPVSATLAASIKVGMDVALVDAQHRQPLAILHIEEIFKIDKHHHALNIFQTTDHQHPGVANLMAQGDFCLAGHVEILSLGHYPQQFSQLFLTPEQTRALFLQKRWSTIVAFQTRNPMHRAHEFLVKMALECHDGVLIHTPLGELISSDFPAAVTTKAITTLIQHYFKPDTVIQAGYPMGMYYAGPREALLHAIFRQNYGCSHIIIGRDHAGIKNYYEPFAAQRIFDHLPRGALTIQALKMDWTFWCNRCEGMASNRSCPHTEQDRILLSGSAVRDMLRRGEQIPPQFSRPEVIAVLQNA